MTTKQAMLETRHGMIEDSLAIIGTTYVIQNYDLLWLFGMVYLVLYRASEAALATVTILYWERL